MARGPTHKPYPPEFRIEAVRLVQEGGRTPRQLAVDLGCSEEAIRVWVKQAERDSGARSDGLTSLEREELRRLRAENRVLRMERDLLKKAGGLLRPGERAEPVTVYRFIEAEKADLPIAFLCRQLGVSPSGFYAWRCRPPSARARADAVLTTQIQAIHAASRSTYGVPRIHAELADAHARHCGRKRVARLMRAAGLVGVCRRHGARTTQRGAVEAPATDAVQRAFSASAPNRLWVADITYLPTWQGFLYLAVVLDAFSRRVVGWAMAPHMRAELVLDALEMALWTRCPAPGLIHHSDHGSQYTSLAFGQRCQRAGIVPSRGTVGDCYDNAMAESFFASLACELIDRSRWRTQSEARMAVFDYIEAFYNPRRRHSALAYLSPQEFERRQAGKAA
ncbi:MAG: IS3 family transposase [Mycobacterium sp.]